MRGAHIAIDLELEGGYMRGAHIAIDLELEGGT